MEKENLEPMFHSHSPTVLSLDGRVTKALKIACDEFVSTGRDLCQFDITISERIGKDTDTANGMFIVTFMGKPSLGKRGLGTANRASGSVIYFISRKKWKITKEQGIK